LGNIPFNFSFMAEHQFPTKNRPEFFERQMKFDTINRERMINGSEIATPEKNLI
jgi:hypothetical protein